MSTYDATSNPDKESVLAEHELTTQNPSGACGISDEMMTTSDLCEVGKPETGGKSGDEMSKHEMKKLGVRY